MQFKIAQLYAILCHVFFFLIDKRLKSIPSYSYQRSIHYVSTFSTVIIKIVLIIYQQSSHSTNICYSYPRNRLNCILTFKSLQAYVLFNIEIFEIVLIVYQRSSHYKHLPFIIENNVLIVYSYSFFQ